MKITNSYDLSDLILHEEIGRGSYGKVYKVKNTKNGEIYAAKISFTPLSDSLLDVHTLSREVNILSKINHPSIVKFIGFSPINFSFEPNPVILTELVTNGTLFDIIDLTRKSLSSPKWDDTHKLINIYGIANAMSYLHSHQTIHRDLKPSNILMNEYLFPKVADFGLSKIIHSKDETVSIAPTTTSIIGTPLYIAPEIYIKNEYTPACDVYSFGIIVYEITTFMEPFKNKSVFEIALDVTNGVRPIIDDFVPDAYRNLIEKCWSQDPKERPTFDQIVTEIKNNKGFITEQVDEDIFLDYIDFIDTYPKEFNSKKQIIQLDEFIKTKTKKFEKISIKDLSLNKKTKKKKRDSLIYPRKQYDLLPQNCRELVNQASDDPEKQFEVGQCLIEEQDGFPLNIELGLKYLDKSIEKRCIESAIYYSRLLISGTIIEQNFEKAKSILEKFFDFRNSIVALLYGKIMKKEKKFASALKYFGISLKGGNAEAMYEYGKMLYKGVGCPKNEKDGRKYLMMAKNNGFTKTDQFLSKQKKVKQALENIPSDKNEQFNYYKKLVNNGVSDAIFKCGLMLFNGDGVEINKKEALKHFKMAADKGNQDAMIKYALMLKNGDDDININKKEAAEYFKKAADLGNDEGMAHYGKMLFYGDGIPADEEEAFGYIKNALLKNNVTAMCLYADICQNKEKSAQYYKMAIEKGSPEAMYKYAMMLLNSESSSFDKNEAVSYLKMAVENGNDKAMYEYASMLRKGQNVTKNVRHAVKHYKMAIEKGNSIAMYSYASMLLAGKEISQDIEEGIHHLRMAIDKGNGNAMYHYAFLFHRGEHVTKNIKEAIKYYKMAIEKGNASAMCNYATILYNGDDVDKDIKEAARYYKMAADNGNVISMNQFALMLYNGIGVSKDINEAVIYFKKAIDGGNNTAMLKYANILFNGDGVVKDVKQAVNYFKMACKNGNSEAMYEYALILISGEAFPKNIDEGLHYLQMSIKKCNSNAMNYYANMLYYGIEVTKDINEAIRYYKMACENGNSDSMFKYATILLNDDTVKKDQNKAIEYLQMAIKKGNSDAMYMLANMLLTGDSVPENRARGILYIKKAMQKGNSNAMLKYALLHQDDKKTYTKYLLMAIDKGNTEAMHLYAKVLYNDKTSTNKEESIKYFKMAADSGDANSMYMYALILWNDDDISKDKSEPIRYFKMASDNGNLDAMYKYAMILKERNRVPVDKSQATNLIFDACKKGHSLSLCTYATMLRTGDLVAVNKKEALRYYKMSCDKGNSEAMLNYGIMLLTGEGVPADKEEGIRFITMAAEKGNIEAMFYYATKLNAIEGIEADKADKYFKAALAKENVDIMFKYSTMLYYGQNVPVNKVEAINIFKKASQKDKFSIYKHAQKMYSNDGIVCDKNDVRLFLEMASAIENSDMIYSYAKMCLGWVAEFSFNAKDEGEYFLKIAANNGNLEAIENYVYKLFNEDKYENKDEIIQYLKKYYSLTGKNKFYTYLDQIYNDPELKSIYLKASADCEDTEAMYEYAELVATGKAGWTNREEAVQYFKMYGEAMNEDTIYKFACKLSHDGNIKEAVYYFKLSADNGNADALYKYAKLVYDCEVYDDRSSNAWYYFKDAADKGNVNAMRKYADMCYNGDTIDKDLQEAACYYKMAADEGDDEQATLKYAFMNLNGDGITRDRDEAKSYFLKAKDMGNDTAIDILRRYFNYWY